MSKEADNLEWDIEVDTGFDPVAEPLYSTTDGDAITLDEEKTEEDKEIVRTPSGQPVSADWDIEMPNDIVTPEVIERDLTKLDAVINRHGGDTMENIESLNPHVADGIRKGYVWPGVNDAMKSIMSEWGASLIGMGRAVREVDNTENIVNKLSPEDQALHAQFMEELDVSQNPSASSAITPNGRYFDLEEQVWRQVSNPEEWNRIQNLMYIGRKEVAMEAIKSAVDDYSYQPPTKDGRQMKEALQDWWLPNTIDAVVTFLPGLADEQKEKYVKGSDAYAMWDKLSDIIDIGQMVYGPKILGEAVGQGQKLVTKVKLKKAEVMLKALETGEGVVKSTGKKIKSKNVKETSGLVAAGVGDAAETASKLRQVQRVVEGFTPGILSVARTQTGLKTQSSILSTSNLADAEKAVAHKEKLRKQITAAEDKELNSTDVDAGAKLKVALQKEAREDARALAALDKEIKAIETRLLAKGGPDELNQKFYETLVDLEEKVREKGRRKFQRIPEDAAKLDVRDYLTKLEAAMSDSAIVANKLDPFMGKLVAMLNPNGPVRGMRSKTDPIQASLMNIHEVLSELKFMQRQMAMSKNPNSGGAVEVLGKLIEDIQGKDNKPGLFDQYKTKVGQKHRDQLIDAMDFWKKEVVERFESWPVYKVGRTDRTGKLLVAPPELINELLSEMRKGNQDVVDLMAKALGKDSTSSAQAWKQVHQTLMDQFIRAVAPDGALDIKRVEKYFRDHENRRPFDYLPGMQNFINDTMRQLDDIRKEKLQLQETLDAKAALNLYQALGKEGMLANPNKLVPMLLNQQSSARRAKEIAKAAGPEVYQALKEMVGAWVLRQADMSAIDPRLRTPGKNADRILQVLNQHKDALNILIGPNHRYRLEQFYEAWKIENVTELPTYKTSWTGKTVPQGNLLAMLKVNLASILSDVVAQQKMSVSKHWIAAKWGVRSLAYVFQPLKLSDIDFILRKAHYDTDALEILEKITDGTMDGKGVEQLTRYLEKQGHIEALELGTGTVYHNMITKARQNVEKAKTRAEAQIAYKDYQEVLASVYASAVADQVVPDEQPTTRRNDQGAL